MDAAKVIHRDHIGAVVDLDYAPTGREFVTGSFDKTVRIFGYDQGRSRDVYHGRRMQIISSVVYTSDAHYILSGTLWVICRLGGYEYKAMEIAGFETYWHDQPKTKKISRLPLKTPRQIPLKSQNKKNPPSSPSPQVHPQCQET